MPAPKNLANHVGLDALAFWSSYVGGAGEGRPTPWSDYGDDRHGGKPKADYLAALGELDKALTRCQEADVNVVDLINGWFGEQAEREQAAAKAEPVKAGK